MMKKFSLVLGTMFLWNLLHAELPKRTPLTLFYADTFCGDYTAKGVGIRDVWSGNIVISDIPGGATVRKAWLYWMFLKPICPAGNGTFNGNPIVGTCIGRDVDPCWVPSDSSFAFRKEVTPWVSGNGTYPVSFSHSGAWVRGEGATLVVLYETSAKPKQVFLIYDGNVELESNPPAGRISTYEWTMQGFKADNPVTTAKITYIFADGQEGTSVKPDSAYYNGSLLDANCTSGADGKHWDTSTYDVTALTPGGSTQASCRHAVKPNPSDCICLEACILAVSKGPCTGIGDINHKTQNVKLEVYPNPLSQFAVIGYQLPAKSPISLEIFDLSGKLVENLLQASQCPGYYEMNWNTEEIPSGIYFARLKTDNHKVTKKIVIAR